MEMENLINQQLESMDPQQLQELMGIAEANSGLLGKQSLSDMILSILHGEPILSWQSLYDSMIGLFMQEIRTTMSFAIEILIVCIAVGLLKNLSSSFEEQSVSKLGNLVISCVIVALCLQNIIIVYNLCSQTMTDMTRLMEVLIALLVPLVLVTGGIASAGVLQAVLLGALTFFTVLMTRLILPATFLSGIFVLANSFTDKPYIKKMAGFLRTFAVTAMGMIVTILSGISALQGMATGSADTVLLKTARFSLDNFIPVIGGFASDSVDLIMSCTKVIKSGVGIFGLLILLTMLLVPLIKLVVIALIYKVAGILSEPIATREISGCFTELGSCIVTMAVILLLGAILFLIFVTILIMAGNGG